MDNNLEKIINDIVWWIPFRNLRNNVRNLLIDNIEKYKLYDNKLNNLENKLNNLENYINYKLHSIDIKSDVAANFSALICDNLNIKDIKLPIPPPPYEYKRMTIIKYAEEYNCRNFVETGTYYGETALFCKDYFDKIYTIELLDILYQNAIEKFKNFKNIKVIKGDNSKELPIILNEINTKTIFWLDGHYCGDNFTAKGDKETPIMEEITTILNHHVKDHVILIDDARCFGVWPDYPTIEKLYNYIKEYRSDFDFEVKNDIIRIILEQSRAEQSRAEQSRAEQSRAEQSRADM